MVVVVVRDIVMKWHWVWHVFCCDGRSAVQYFGLNPPLPPFSLLISTPMYRPVIISLHSNAVFLRILHFLLLYSPFFLPPLPSPPGVVVGVQLQCTELTITRQGPRMLWNLMKEFGQDRRTLSLEAKRRDWPCSSPVGNTGLVFNSKYTHIISLEALYINPGSFN